MALTKITPLGIRPLKSDGCEENPFLGGGFKYFLFSPLFGEDFHFDFYFSDGLKPPTSFLFGPFVTFHGLLLLNFGGLFDPNIFVREIGCGTGILPTCFSRSVMQGNQCLHLRR